MKYLETPLAGAFVIDLERHEDNRGFFARTFCADEFAQHGLESRFVQCNVSYNRLAGTIRGMHYQKSPHGEAKLMRCTSGEIFTVIVDMRTDSATQGQWFSIKLSQENRRSLYIPKGFANGFQSLRNDTEVFYQMSDPYVPGAGRGFRFDDSEIAIQWPLDVTIISDKDQQLPSWSECEP